MKKIICCLLIAVLSVGIVGCGIAGTVATPAPTMTPKPINITIPDELYFGMKESEIIALYGEPDMEFGDCISYEKDIKNENFDRYDFVLGVTEKGLQMVQHAFGYSYDSENPQYQSDTEKIKSEIVKNFGESSNYSEKWLNEKYRNDPASWDRAISKSHLEITYIWDLENYIITLRTNHLGIFLDYTAK